MSEHKFPICDECRQRKEGAFSIDLDEYYCLTCLQKIDPSFYSDLILDRRCPICNNFMQTIGNGSKCGGGCPYWEMNGKIEWYGRGVLSEEMKTRLIERGKEK